MAFGVEQPKIQETSKEILTRPKTGNTLKFQEPVSPVEGVPRMIAPKATRGATSGVSVQGYSATPQNANIIRGSDKKAYREALRKFEKLASNVSVFDLEVISEKILSGGQ